MKKREKKGEINSAFISRYSSFIVKQDHKIITFIDL
jgi:hypothetical protein